MNVENTKIPKEKKKEHFSSLFSEEKEILSSLKKESFSIRRLPLRIKMIYKF